MLREVEVMIVICRIGVLSESVSRSRPSMGL